MGCIVSRSKTGYNYSTRIYTVVAQLIQKQCDASDHRRCVYDRYFAYKKYGTQSALTDFREYTMLEPGPLAPFVGFTQVEVKRLCEEYPLDFDQAQKWYDGYIFEQAGHIYSPNSIIEAIQNKSFANYWTQTETYESLMTYIDLNFDGLKDSVIDMIGGMRCKVDVGSFQNDMTSLRSKDDVLTLFVHLGYLAYDRKRGKYLSQMKRFERNLFVQ